MNLHSATCHHYISSIRGSSNYSVNLDYPWYCRFSCYIPCVHLRFVQLSFEQILMEVILVRGVWSWWTIQRNAMINWRKGSLSSSEDTQSSGIRGYRYEGYMRGESLTPSSVSWTRYRLSLTCLHALITYHILSESQLTLLKFLLYPFCYNISSHLQSKYPVCIFNCLFPWHSNYSLLQVSLLTLAHLILPFALLY